MDLDIIVGQMESRVKALEMQIQKEKDEAKELLLKQRLVYIHTFMRIYVSIDRYI